MAGISSSTPGVDVFGRPIAGYTNPPKDTYGNNAGNPAQGSFQSWMDPDTGRQSRGDVGDMGYADRMQQQWLATKNAKLKTDTINRVLGGVSALNSIGGGSASATMGGSGGYTPPAAPVGPSHVSIPDSQAADAAALTTAKERAGQTLAGGAKSLRGLLNGRGLVGSGIEGHELEQLTADSMRSQNATSADLLRQGLDRTSHAEDLNFEGNEGYASRSNDFNLRSAGMANDFTTQQQQIALQAKTAAQSQLSDLLRAVGSLV